MTPPASVAQRAEGTQERFLGEVLRIDRVTGPCQEVAIDRSEKLQVEFAERLWIVATSAGSPTSPLVVDSNDVTGSCPSVAVIQHTP